MTDLATRIADVKKKAETLCKDDGTTEGWLDAERLWKMGFGYNQAHYIAAVSPDLFIEMPDEIDRLKAQLEKAREELAKSAKLRFLADCYADTPDEYTQHDLLQEALLRARVHAELAQKEKE